MKRLMYPTPLSRDYKGTHGSRSFLNEDRGDLRMFRILPNYATFILSNKPIPYTGGGQQEIEWLNNTVQQAQKPIRDFMKELKDNGLI